MRGALGWGTVITVGVLTACGGTGDQANTAAEALSRDITLQASAAPAVEVASAVELGRPESPRRTVPRRVATPKPVPAPAPDPAPEAAPAPEPVSVTVLGAAVETPAPAPAPAPGGRELAPGQTVMVLPAASGSSDPGPEDVYLPADMGRGIKAGGGHCPHPPRRGRPIGIVGFR